QSPRVDRGHDRPGLLSVTDLGEEPIVVEPPVDLERGTVLAGRYQIEAFVGKGGSGVVLRAFDRITQSPVALKILSQELANNPRWAERFSRELRLGRQIQHPHVCRVFDIGESDGHRFLSMELATGGTLRESLMPDAPPRSFAERLADARALVEGLAALHAAGIIHRDVKPENLLRMEDGRVVLTDFGLATSPGQSKAVTVLVGTPSYMAPEIVMGDPASSSSDVWALGVTMHEILFGKRPEWDLVGGERRFRSPLGKGAPAPERALAELCARCAAERPERRPADAGEVLALLTRRKTPARAMPTVRTMRNRRSQLGWAAVAAGVVVAAAIAGARGKLLLGAWATLNSSARPPLIKPRGAPNDWGASTRVLAEFPGNVRCFTTSPDGKAAQIIWGERAAAETIDVATGRRAPMRLLPITYQNGCPDLSPNGEQLLFAATDSSGAVQVMLSNSADGSNARAITRGSAPVWLANGREFLYNLDGIHVAAFSLPTMTFTIVGNSDLDRVGFVELIVLNEARNLVAIKRSDERNLETVSVHSWPGLATLGRFELPPASTRIAFSSDSSRLLFSVEPSPSGSLLAGLDWRSGMAIKMGAVPGSDVRGLRQVGSDQTLILSRRLSGDVWLREPTGVDRPLTTDGENWTADLTSSRYLAVGKRTSEGSMVVVGYDPAGRQVFASDGPNDRMPSFSADGRVLVFVRLSTRTVVSCAGPQFICRDVHTDDQMPMWPRLSPDERTIAYVTQFGAPRLRIVSVTGEVDRDMGPARAECPSVWTSPDRLWVYQGTEAERYWAETDVTSGSPTGYKKTASGGLAAETCSRDSEEWQSPFFRRVRVVRAESSSLRVLRQHL
ncbi:MAG TPA: serine/threonine-protein kinase, partial [Polyangia bacterium]|nr:serine/threonine-protein kinase [Polyangia bacterium]